MTFSKIKNLTSKNLYRKFRNCLLFDPFLRSLATPPIQEGTVKRQHTQRAFMETFKKELEKQLF